MKQYGYIFAKYIDVMFYDYSAKRLPKVFLVVYRF